MEIGGPTVGIYRDTETEMKRRNVFHKLTKKVPEIMSEPR